MKMTLLPAFIALLIPAFGGAQVKDINYGASVERLQARAGQIDLTGTWQMAGSDPDTANPFGSGRPRALPDMSDWKWHEVTVPGSVRSGLLEAQVIEDPYWDQNAGKSLWTEKKDWWFKKSVTVPKTWSGKHVLIGFDGMDYNSSVWFNGKFLGDHEGMYGGPAHDVTSLVRYGQPNEVIVQVHPGGTNEPGKSFKGYIFMKWHYLTDISPRGIWRGVRLVALGPVRLENPFVKVLSANDKEAELEITVDVHGDDAGPATIEGTIAGENFRGGKQSFTVEVPRDANAFTYRLRVKNPKLWWPAGMGDPNLYRLTLSAGDSDSVSTTFGIRTIEFGQNPGLKPMSYGAGDQRDTGLSIEPTANTHFMCRINGRLISMRGAGGFGCHDQIYRFHDRKDAWFIKAALAMNFNFLRLHGAGLIGTDDFYDLCDRMGMMVWQEFMVSNMGLSGVHFDVWRTQTVQSILRLRNHPSLVYWCGGNEFNPDDTATENKKVVDMFEESLKTYDGTRPFSRAAQYVNDPHYNDQSGFYGGDKIAACTEYAGAYAGMIIGERSLRKFVPGEDAVRWPPVTQDELDTVLPPDALVGWDNSRKGPFVSHTALTGRLAGWIGDLMLILPQSILFGIPRTMQQAFDVTQMCGEYTNAYIIETFRSRWPTPSLYASWDYAPIWPMSVIWGPVDYYGVLQPSAYLYKRAQEPLHVLMQMDPVEHMKSGMMMDAFPKVFEPGGDFKGRVYVVSDLDHSAGAHTVELQVFDQKLDLIRHSAMKLAGMERGPGSMLLGTFTWHIPASMSDQTALVCTSLRDGAGKLVSRSVYPIWISSQRARLLSDVATRRDDGPWLTEMQEAQTKLKITPVGERAVFSERDYLPGGRRHLARVTLDITNIGNRPAFHAGVEITNADCRYIFDDNYFTLMSGESRRITAEIDRSTEPFYDYVKPSLVQPVGKSIEVTARAWNAPAEVVSIPVAR